MYSQFKFLVTTSMAGIIGLMGLVAPASLYADQRRDEHRTHHKAEKRSQHKPNVVIHRGPAHAVRSDRIRHYRDVIVVRPYGHWYPGYGGYRLDNDAFKWLSFTAITLKILDNLNEQQQREHEAAQIKATQAEVGETIIWNKSGASGSVTVLRDGTSTAGRYCREFQQEVTIGRKREVAYGTACRNPDGSWEVVSTGSP